MAYSRTVTSESLVRPFVDAAPVAVRPAVEAIADLDRRLWSLVAEGRAAWPDLPLDAKVLVEFVARHLTADLAEAALDGLRPADLYHACASAQGSTAARSIACTASPRFAGSRRRRSSWSRPRSTRCAPA